MTLRTVLSAAVVPFLVACDDPAGPDRDDVSGTYVIESAHVYNDGVENEFISAGLEATLVLTADGESSGTMVIPYGQNLPGFEVWDLAGRWHLDGSSITLEHDPASPLGALDIRYDDGALHAEGVIEHRRYVLRFVSDP